MADKGTVGIDAAQMTVVGSLGQPTAGKLRIMEGLVYQIGLSKDTTDGSPTQPSMKQTLPHRRSFFWPVASGARTISVNVKFTADSGTGFRPKLVIKANAELSINADVITEAVTGTGVWKTIGPVTVSPSAQGVLEIELRYDPVLGEANTVHWDNVVVT